MASFQSYSEIFDSENPTTQIPSCRINCINRVCRSPEDYTRCDREEVKTKNCGLEVQLVSDVLTDLVSQRPLLHFSVYRYEIVLLPLIYAIE